MQLVKAVLVCLVYSVSAVRTVPLVPYRLKCGRVIYGKILGRGYLIGRDVLPSERERENSQVKKSSWDERVRLLFSLVFDV